MRATHEGINRVNGEKLHVILNKHSAGGRTAKRWPKMETEIRRLFGNFEVSETTAPFAGEPLTRQALEKGANLILAIGGDGTFSEATNGFFVKGAAAGTLVNPEASLAFLTSGSGCDVRKTLGWPEPEAITDMLEIIKSGRTRMLDVGRMSYENGRGERGERYFINVTSFGLGGAVSNAVNSSRIAKRLGGTFAFYWHALVEGLSYRNQRVRFQIDDDYDETFDITIAAVANCQYFGGGMHIAPNADPSDGLFDVLIGHDLTKIEFARILASISTGDHVNHPKVIQRRGKRVVATSLDPKPVLHDVDGESPGSLPSTFEILPQAIRVRG